MNIDSIQNGIVLDHITAGKAMLVYKYLHLDRLDCSVAIIKNATSRKMGRKDILKIDHPDYDINLDILGYVDPGISVCIIKDGVTVEKKKVGNKIYIKKIASEIDNYTICGRRKYGNKK